MILIIGEDPTLLITRALMLSEWGCTTTNMADAPDALCAGIYDLILFCQTVPESMAVELLAIALKVNQGVQVLTILPVGGKFNDHYESVTFTVDFSAPERMKEVVGKLLMSAGLKSNRAAQANERADPSRVGR